VKFAFIAEVAEENAGKPRVQRFPVTFMCEMLVVSTSGYYAWKKRPPSARSLRDAELTEKIEKIDAKHEGRCGIERILWDLRDDYSERTSERRVRRLARAAGVECVHPRPYKTTTVRDERPPSGLVDLVERDFTADAPDRLWVGDITYVHTLGGFAYLATVIDLYSNRVVGWAVADHMRTELVLEALDMALVGRVPGIGEVIFHSDRGSQYTSHEFRDHCFANGIIPVGRAHRNLLRQRGCRTIQRNH
jgi:transposase InsO family protein